MVNAVIIRRIGLIWILLVSISTSDLQSFCISTVTSNFHFASKQELNDKSSHLQLLNTQTIIQNGIPFRILMYEDTDQCLNNAEALKSTLCDCDNTVNKYNNQQSINDMTQILNPNVELDQTSLLFQSPINHPHNHHRHRHQHLKYSSQDITDLESES